MKKCLILLLCLFTTDSFASGITSNTATAPCTNNTLETYSGNTNLQADWAPNEIQLRWYNNNTLMDVQSSANTCVYDGALAVPQTAPIRTGYTFAGWTVRPEMDFATLNTANNPTAWYGRDADGNWCAYMENNVAHEGRCNNFEDIIELKDLMNHEGKIVFAHGTLYFMGKCSAKSGNNNNRYFDNDKSNWAATSAELDISGDKKYCWCRATGYKPNNQDTIYSPSKQLDFVFIREDSVDHCDFTCGIACAHYIHRDWVKPKARSAVLETY